MIFTHLYDSFSVAGNGIILNEVIHHTAASNLRTCKNRRERGRKKREGERKKVRLSIHKWFCATCQEKMNALIAKCLLRPGRSGPVRRMRLAHCSLACRQLSVVRISGTELISPPLISAFFSRIVSRCNNVKPDAFCVCWVRLFLVVSS